MAQSRKEVWQEICNEIRRGSAHILITGSRESGKTTLLERLLKEGMLPGGEQAGIRSFALRNGDGTPSQIILEDRSDGQQQAIAEGFVPGRGPKVKAEVLDHWCAGNRTRKIRFRVLGSNR
jgi:GTPase SAR1 family protein